MKCSKRHIGKKARNFYLNLQIFRTEYFKKYIDSIDAPSDCSRIKWKECRKTEQKTQFQRWNSHFRYRHRMHKIQKMNYSKINIFRNVTIFFCAGRYFFVDFQRMQSLGFIKQMPVIYNIHIKSKIFLKWHYSSTISFSF